MADAIVDIVNYWPFGKRPFRVHYDPTQDGADLSCFTVLRPPRAAKCCTVSGLSDLLKPKELV